MKRTLYRSVLLSTGADAALLQRNMAAGADLLCIDLEDTVEDKAAARALFEAFLGMDYVGARGARISPLTAAEGLEDLLLIRAMARKPDAVVLTKVHDSHEIRIAAEILPDLNLIALIETPEAVEDSSRMAAASDRLCALMFGGKDLAMAMGATRNWDGLLWPRGRMVSAAKATGLYAIDENFRPLNDLEALTAVSLRSRDMGFQGRLTISADHVAVIHRVYV